MLVDCAQFDVLLGMHLSFEHTRWGRSYREIVSSLSRNEDDAAYSAFALVYVRDENCSATVGIDDEFLNATRRTTSMVLPFNVQRGSMGCVVG